MAEGEERKIPSQERLNENHVPLDWRDTCADLLITLNKCRIAGGGMPWNCHHERHEYEHCQYDEWKRRRDIKEAAAEDG